MPKPPLILGSWPLGRTARRRCGTCGGYGIRHRPRDPQTTTTTPVVLTHYHQHRLPPPPYYPLPPTHPFRRPRTHPLPSLIFALEQFFRSRTPKTTKPTSSCRTRVENPRGESFLRGHVRTAPTSTSGSYICYSSGIITVIVPRLLRCRAQAQRGNCPRLQAQWREAEPLHWSKVRLGYGFRATVPPPSPYKSLIRCITVLVTLPLIYSDAASGGGRGGGVCDAHVCPTT